MCIHCVAMTLKIIYFQLKKIDVIENCIKLYFQKTPPSNQFLCRAYLCQAQLNAPTSCNEQV